jgi:uncharacterized cupredoxin-like copper-binding protein
MAMRSHRFAAAGTATLATVLTLAGGASTRLSVPLRGGSYELWCTVDAHKERGMDKTIQVG